MTNAKIAQKAAYKLAAGGLTRKEKAKTVGKWAAAMKALLQGGK